MKPFPSWVIYPPAAIIMSAASCFATDYLTIEEAQKLIFPEARNFIEISYELSDEQRDAITDRSDVKVKRKKVKLWEARTEREVIGYYFLDEVIGKHELITYAVGISPQGAVKQIEVLSYRENHGGEIRDQRWRQQFVNKTLNDEIVLDSDIMNISGATLSCLHVTEGVKRLLATFENFKQTQTIKSNSHDS